jgi:hypothetical protein
MNSTTIINGGNISGPTGIEIRAGKLIVNDGIILGTSETYEVNANASGTTTKGAAIGVSQHNTQQPIQVIINGGNLKSVVPLCEVNPMDNPPEATELVTIEVNQGEFESNGAETINIEDTAPSIPFITGGTYTDDPSTYVKDGYGVVKHSEDKYEVTKIHNVTIDSSSIGNISTSNNKYPYKSVVKINIQDKSRYAAIIEIKDASGNIIELDGNEFTMPDSDVIIKVVYKELVNPLTTDNILYYEKMLAISILSLLGIIIISKKIKDIK